jgi:hypothetical protein
MSKKEHYEEFMQEIFARSDANSNFSEVIFTERMCEYLTDQAVIENFSHIGFQKSESGMRVDAWNYDQESETGELILILSDFRAENEIQSLTRTDINRNFKRAEKFFTQSLKSSFYQSLEDSAPCYETARLIYKLASEITKVRFILLSNAELSTQVKSVDDALIEGYSCVYDIWDIGRIYRIESSGKSREDIVIDFKKIMNKGVPCLPAFTGSDTSESYLLVMPGSLIANLYDQYGDRLLEQNVRTFLQFRGKVNNGIRQTIQNEPDMFFAYNNGLTATAEHVATDKEKRNIGSVTNLQIVNGGQTTASLFTAMSKNNADLTKTHVQVKLTVIAPDKIEEVVPKISEYANTQNRVNAADFFSNHPFHLRIEGLSRNLWAPSAEGTLLETHWYYERARGQYANVQANLTAAQKREFLKQNPKHQMFTKTDLAKFMYSFDMLPHTVSKGAQANFANFAQKISAEWEKNDKPFNELYFKHMIAKAIVFRYLDKNIMGQSWYGGFKANIITYSLAKLAHLLSETGKYLNFGMIWKQQKLSTVLQAQLMDIAMVVNEQIQDTPDGFTNVTQWCKREECWKSVKGLYFQLMPEFRAELVGKNEMEQLEKAANTDQQVMNGIESQIYAVNKGCDYWALIRGWNENEHILSPKENGILDRACKRPPTEKESPVLIEIEKKAKEEGFSS